MAGGIVDGVAAALEGGGVDLARLGLAWARVAPAIAIVPAFGLRALSASARAAVALAMAACIAPAVAPPPSFAGGWAAALLVEAARGLPVAVAAALPLWAATMAGGLADALRGAQESVQLPVVEGRATPLGALLGALAATIFLATGGPARVAEALVAPLAEAPVLRAAHALAEGPKLALALAAPLVGASIVTEVAAAFVARAASPAQVHALLAPLRAVTLLGIAALAFGRIADALAVVVGGAP